MQREENAVFGGDLIRSDQSPILNQLTVCVVIVEDDSTLNVVPSYVAAKKIKIKKA